MEKDATTGRCVFRNSRAEERMQHQHSLQQEACLEKIYDKVRNEIEEGEDSQGKVTCLVAFVVACSCLQGGCMRRVHRFLPCVLVCTETDV